MKPIHISYLSLGSNLDDKLENLEKAVRRIHESIAQVQAVSSVYETPAWGFEGNDFYNICIEIHTELTADTLLKSILDLEIQLGRTRKNDDNYHNRTIDIDIISFGQEVTSTSQLILPHPKAVDRKFVLYPLQEINKNFVFPASNTPIDIALKNCVDNSTINKTNQRIVVPKA